MAQKKPVGDAHPIPAQTWAFVLVDCCQHKIPHIDGLCHGFRMRGNLRLFGGSCAAGSDRRRPEQQAEARLAGGGGAFFDR